MVSSRDVAKLAGVSQTTVSRVLNGSPLVKPKTIDKVEKAMQQLQFRPNHIARSLVSNKTNTIALITESLQNPFYVETTTRIVTTAAERGYQVIVHFDGAGDKRKLYDAVLNQRVDGIIMSSILLDDDVYHKLNQLSLPFVTFNRRHRSGGNFVELDNVRAVTLAVDYLVSLGHRRLAYIGGPTAASTFQDRMTGFEEACRRHRLAPEAVRVRMTDTEPQTVKPVCRELWAEPAEMRPTAILAATDAIALACLDDLLAAGVRVPEDVSLLGIDNIQWSSHSAVRLSTVGAAAGQSMGELAINRLLHLLDKGDPSPIPSQIRLEPQLFPRHTTAPPAMADRDTADQRPLP